MQTAAISYRVSDFLKQHPPFDSMAEEDLLALAGRGRVKFHEADEFVCWQGEAHCAFVFVIQQGSVSLWEKAEGEERLRDIRGPGDMVGLERFLGSATSQYSARTNGDVVLYALNAGDFEKLTEKYPQAGRYLASHASVSADCSGGQPWSAAEVLLAEVMNGWKGVPCEDTATIRDAARRMAESGAPAVGVAREDGRAAGVITAERLARWVAEDGAEAERPLTELLDEETAIVREHSTVTECLLAMAEGNGTVVVTRDGTIKSPMIGVATGADLVPVFGEDPAGIVRRIRAASDCDTLRRLNQRARAFLLAQLSSAAEVEWLARFAHLVDAGILGRLLQLAEAGEQEICWCFYGAAGRGESLTAVAPQLAVIAADESKRAAAAASLERVEAMLPRCGYVERHERAGDQDCATIAEWKERFGGWIADPIRKRVAQARSRFDLKAVRGDTSLWRELEESVGAKLREEPGFTMVLANDCLESLPPMTFFREQVVEESGEQSGVFQLERSALRPLVDVARVFGVAAGAVLGSSSADRFRLACGLAPEQEAVFREASETLRVVLHHQARAGIHQHTEGFELPASQITAQERLVLKSGFRSILRLLEFTAEFGWQVEG